MRCLVFGSNGYIGKHLVEMLLNKDYEVIIPLDQKGQIIDLTNEELVNIVDWNVDSVFMFAGVTGTVASFDNHKKFLIGNDLILLNVLNSIRLSSHRPRVVFPSSRLVYRGSEIPLTETAELEARTIYSNNKISCEQYLHTYSLLFDIPFTILRICVPYANDLSKEYSFGTVGNFTKQAKNNALIILYGTGSIRRTFTHIEDLCRFTILANEHDKAINEVFNIPGDNLSLYEVAFLIATRFGATVKCVEWPEFDSRMETGSTVFDSTKLLVALKTELIHSFYDWVNVLDSR
jgi:UDP-glucose 4-epimerase